LLRSTCFALCPPARAVIFPCRYGARTLVIPSTCVGRWAWKCTGWRPSYWKAGNRPRSPRTAGTMACILKKFSGRKAKSMSDAMRSQSIVDAIGHKLREDIISGRLSPGEQLVEVELADAYKASRNSIREVLHMLVRDGLATSLRYRGVFVRTFCEADLQDIYTARRTIQMQAIRCGPAYDEALLRQMAEVLDQSRAALAQEEWRN